MEASIVISIIGLIISAISVSAVIYFNTKNGKKTDVKDIEQRIAERVEINCKLDSINQGMNDIRVQITSLVKDVQSQNERLVKVEESAKQAHKRLDGLETRINGKEVKDHE